MLQDTHQNTAEERTNQDQHIMSEIGTVFEIIEDNEDMSQNIEDTPVRPILSKKKASHSPGNIQREVAKLISKATTALQETKNNEENKDDLHNFSRYIPRKPTLDIK